MPSPRRLSVRCSLPRRVFALLVAVAGLSAANLALVPGAARRAVAPPPTCTATQLTVGIAALTAPLGQGETVTVTALDANAQTCPTYSGTVHFTSTDTSATLPADYTFVPGTDGGSHQFTVTFGTPGFETVTAADSGNSIQGTSPNAQVEAVLYSNGTNVADLGSAAVSPVNTTAGSVTIKLTNSISLSSVALAPGFGGSGAPNDFAVGSPNCAVSGTVQTCTLPVTFQPSRPGVRQAPLAVTGSDNQTYYLGLSGTGTGGALAFTPGIINSAQTFDPSAHDSSFGSVDSAGNLYLADVTGLVVQKRAPDGTVSTVAGTGAQASSSPFSGGATPAATSTPIDGPEGVRLNAAGDMYIPDAGDNVVLKVDHNTGKTVVVAGAWAHGSGGFSGDNGPAATAQLKGPADVVLDAQGNLYIADLGNSEVRRVDAATGIITNYAGSGSGVCSSSCVPTFGRAAAGQPLNQPAGLAIDDAGNLYISDIAAHAVYRVDASSHDITLFAGSCTSGVSCSSGDSGDGAAANLAALNKPRTIALDTAGDLYIADQNSNVVRRVDATASHNATPGTIRTIAGGGSQGGGIGDGGAATDAVLNQPEGVWVDSIGTVYIGDSQSGEVRSIAVTLGQFRDFHSVLKGTTSAAQSLLITDVGNDNFTVNTFATTPNPGDFSQPTSADCGSALTPGTGCTVSVTFAPTVVGSESGTVSVANTGVANASASLAGAGVQVTASPGSLVFASNGGLQTATQTVTVTNPSTSQSVVVTGVTVAQSGGTDYSAHFPVGTNNCSALAAGANCTVLLSYSPGAGQDEPEAATLQVADTVGGAAVANSPQTVALSGALLVPPTAGAATGGDGQSATIGTQYANVLKLTVTGSGGAPSPGVSVTFTAPASGASVVFSDTGSNTETVVTDLNGVATSAPFYANQTAGAVSIAASAVYNCTVVNASFSETNTALSANVGSTAATLTFTFPFSGTTGISAIQVLTQGATGLDFGRHTSSLSTDCKAGTQYTTGQFCTVQVDFTPKAPGARPGAVVLYTGTAHPYTVAQTIFVGGTGVGPALAFPVQGSGSPAVSTLTANAGSPVGVTVDDAGNVFYIDAGAVAIKEIKAGQSTPITLASSSDGLSSPTSLAVDGAGDVYFTDPGNLEVGEIPVVQGGFGAVNTTLLSTSFDGYGITVDSGGGVYYDDGGNIYTFPAGSTSPTASQVNLSGVSLSSPRSLAVAGTSLYIADSGLGANGLVRVDLSSLAATSVTRSGVTLSQPTGVAVDAAGNVYVGDSGLQAVYELPADGGNAFALSGGASFATGGPGALALDAKGNLYAPDTGTTSGAGIYEFTLGTAPSLAFGTAPRNGSSAAQTVEADNIGNADLIFSANPAVGTSNFSTSGTVCSPSSHVASGHGCNLVATFTPASFGALSDSLTLTDNALNASNATQTLALSGTGGIGSAAKLVFSQQPTSAPVNTSISPAVTVTVEDADGNVVTTDSSHVTLAIGTNPGSATLGGSATATAVNGVATFSNLTLSAAGTGYTLSASDGGLTGATSNTFNVTQGAITVTASSPAAITYGDATPTVTGSVTSGTLLGGDTLASIGVTCSVTVTGAGTVPTICSGSSTAYTITYVNGSLTVNKAAITVTASSPAAITYGQAAPTVTGTVTAGALVGTDTLTSIGVTCSAGSVATAGAVVTACSGSPANYTVTYVAGSLTVNKAAITVTASSPAAITYGDAAPAVTGTVTSGALVSPDTLTSIGVTCSAESITAAGSVVTACAGSPVSYNVTFVAGSLTVNKAAITVTASSPAAITYGDAAPAVTGTVTSGALVSPDTLTSIGVTCSAESITAAGSVATTCTGSPVSYNVTFVPGSLTVNKTSITVTASSPAAITYGQAAPTVTGTVTAGALVGTDTLTSIGVTCSAGSITAAGSVATTCTGSPVSYNVTFVPGSLTVNKASITVTASSPAAITYGDAAPTVTGAVTSGALVSPDTLTSIGVTCSAGSVAAAGTVPTACTGSPVSYNVTYVAGSLTVNKAAITVTASSPAAITYGDAAPTVTGTVTSGALVGTDTLTSIGVTCSAGSVAEAGTVPTACAGSPVSYNVTFVPGSFTVNKAAITVTASSPAAITYGQAAPTVTGTVTSGALGGTDTLTSIGVTCSAGSVAAAGTVPTACSGFPVNYTVTYVAGSLTVNKAVLTFTVQDATRAYGVGGPAFTGTFAGFVNHDAASVVTGNASFSTTATTTSDPGTYPITGTQGTLAAANYSFAFVPGALTITKAGQTITFGALADQTLGAAPFALTASSSSNLPISFSVVSGPATISGSTVTLTGTGVVTIEADQGGNTDYTAATPARQSFTVAGGLGLGLNATTLTFGSQPLKTTSAAQTVIVTNTGSAALSINSVSASGDFAAAANCPSVPVNGTCAVSVTFTPTATGARTGTLTINDNAPGSPHTVALSGTGTAAGVVVTPGSLIFGGQVVATTSAAQTVTILNTGTADLHVSNIAVTGDFAASGNCSIVPAGSDCSISVTFTPTATGARAGTLTVTDDAGDGSQVVTLSGTGTAAGATLNPANLNFPATSVGGTSVALTTTLTNTGTAALIGISVAAQGDFAQTSTCGATLAAGASCTVSVTFTPTVAAAETGAIVVSDNLGQQVAALAGAGTAAGPGVSTGQLIFGSQLVGTSSDAQTVVVSNSGNGPLTLGTIVAPAGYTFTTNCGASLPAGASCTVNVIFTPDAPGPDSGALTIPTGAGDQSVAVQGTGTNPGLAITPSFAIFGAQIVGTTSPAQTLTATNTGTAALSLAKTTVSSDFSESDECPATLQPGASCLLSVSFSPSALGNRSGSVTVADSTGQVSAVATLSGQGTLPGIAIAPATVSFGGVPVGKASHAQTVTVSNVGTASLTLASVAASGDFSETTNCLTAPIAPGGNCVISVTMTPSTIGTRTGTIAIVDPATGTHIVALGGVGQAAALDIFPSHLDFGSAPVPQPGAPATLAGTVLSVTLTNVGNLPVVVNGYAVSGDFNQTNSCPSTLAPNARCTLSLTFSPTALGNRTGTLTISDNVDGGSQTVSLTGFGSPGGLTLSPPVLNFGVQVVGVTSKAQQATLTNHTGEDINNLVITPSGEYGETNDCGSTLANGKSCNLQITVTPVTVGDITGNVIVSGTLAQPIGGIAGAGILAAAPQAVSLKARPQASSTSFSLGVVAMTATAIPPGIGFSVPQLSFSITAVGSAATGQTITITNTGNTLPLTNFTIAGTNNPEFPFTTDCPSTLAPQASCTVTVKFTPTGAGLRTGFLNFAADGGITAQMPESGVGIGPQLTVAPSTLVYAARPVATTSAPQTLLLQNTGGLPLSLTGIAPSGDYKVTGTTCALPQTLAVNATCTVSVGFTPTAVGNRNASITFTSNSVDGAVVVALNGSSNTAGLTIAPLSLAFGAEGVGVASAAKTFTVTNNNSGPIGIQGIAIAPTGQYTESSNCPASLGAGANCTVSVVFTPTAVGEQDAAVNITNDAGVQAVALTGAGSDFAITYAGTPPSAVSIDSGAKTTYHLGLTSQDAASQTIALSCAADPGFSCSLSAPSVALSAASPGSFDLVLTANQRLGEVPVPSLPSGRAPWLLLGAALGSLLGAALWKRRRMPLSLAGASLLLVFSAACGTPKVAEVPSTHYVTVTATSSTGAKHSRTLDLVEK